MKQFWVDIRPWNKEIATTAIESGADALFVDKAEDVKRLGRITTVAPDGDIKPGMDFKEIIITDKESENKAARLGKDKLVIVTTSDWTVIPLENLVAQSKAFRGNGQNFQHHRPLSRGTNELVANGGCDASDGLASGGCAGGVKNQVGHDQARNDETCQTPKSGNFHVILLL